MREWKRGTPLADATLVYEGEKGDVAASGYFYHDRGETYEWRQRAVTFWTSEHEIRMPDGAFAKVPVQDDAQTGWEQSVDPACDAPPDPATVQLRKRRPLT